MMKNKLLLFALIVAVAVFVTGCSANESKVELVIDERFVYDYKTSAFDFGTGVIIDKETGCCYLFVKHGYGAGLCQLTDANGYPLIWEE
jgi:hypothetical protein